MFFIRINGAQLDLINNLGQCFLNEEDRNGQPDSLDFIYPYYEYIEASCSNNNSNYMF